MSCTLFIICRNENQQATDGFLQDDLHGVDLHSDCRHLFRTRGETTRHARRRSPTGPCPPVAGRESRKNPNLQRTRRDGTERSSRGETVPVSDDSCCNCPTESLLRDTGKERWRGRTTVTVFDMEDRD